jgi:hypothetical protein
MKCVKLRECVCCCTIIHPGQKNYGQVLEIRILRPEKISKVLDRRDFDRIHEISRRIQLVKQNNFCSVFLTKL